jgi:uncharacterized protein (DUF302 family)
MFHAEAASMPYYLSKTLSLPFEDTVARLKLKLGEQGFGVLTEIDVRATMKAKLGVEFRNYRILGACNPPFAYKALQAEDKIGVLLPCNVVVQESAGGKVEVAAINPVETMRAVASPALQPIAEEIAARLAKVLEAL